MFKIFADPQCALIGSVSQENEVGAIVSAVLRWGNQESERTDKA